MKLIYLFIFRHKSNINYNLWTSGKLEKLNSTNQKVE